MRILIVDNFDSFTYNLANAMGELGGRVSVVRNNVSLEEALLSEPDAILLSPGPGHPRDSRLTLDMLKSGIETPILGVCLGHQAIGEAFGGTVVKAVRPRHGKTSEITHSEEGLFEGMPNPFAAVRYHSLVIERKSIPSCLKVTAETSEKEVMAVEHESKAIFGVQFHPESILTQQGQNLFKNFYQEARR